MSTFSDAYRSVSQFHENEKLAGWLARQRIVVWLTPARRRSILFFGAIAVGVAALFQLRKHSAVSTWLEPSLAMLSLVGLAYLLYLAAANFSRLPAAVRRRPQMALHALFWLLVALAWIAPPEAGIWRTVVILVAVSMPYLIWRYGYMLISGQRGKAAGTSFRDHLIYIWPTWGGTNTPIGKGADYLSQCEAKSADAYARSVLAGTKLLILSAIWEGAKFLIGALVFSYPKSPLKPLLGDYGLGIPRMRRILIGEVSAPLPIVWLSLYLEMILETVDIAARGHRWIGILRLFGFNAFRNTYKPLLAVSVVDFWNRYYYYFKELLVEFFFFPTYVRYFRTRPKLRIFAAVFAAAFLGNMYHHVLRADKILVAGEWAQLWARLNPRLVYCVLLALGIYVSMLRQQKKRGRAATAETEATRLRKAIRIAGVWTFFSIIYIWDLKGNMTISTRFGFFLSLFGL
ncbi:MAG: hypothetical protein A3F90_03045 [Deltaproteobacteria bacterium RIFCSPLOWO2_12_FULL_60_19]|nr:MAG: hypothetical protein A3F90_03045 [Deltaproteobacteria bacterium RIFCSPLOWO2_12_FULL_60_19]